MPLSESERRFAVYFALYGNVREAALRAGGLKPNQPPEEAGVELLARAPVRRYIKKLSALLGVSARAGLRRIAFGDITGGAKLALHECDENPAAVERLDLFAVSEIKHGKDGLDVKFYDRLRALELLLSDDKSESGGLKSFYRALEKSARTTGSGEAADEIS